MSLSLNFVNSILGLHLTADEVISKLILRQIHADVDTDASAKASPDTILKCIVPAHRSDVLHPTDLAEDVMIAYGLSNIPTHGVLMVRLSKI